MTFTINQAALLSALNIAQRAVGTNNVIPILSSYHFKSTEDRLTITGNNMQTSVSITIPFEVKGSVDIAVFAPRILGIVKDLPNQELTFTASEGKLIIKSGSGKYTMPYENGEDFPRFPEIEADTVTLPSSELIELIDKTLFAAGEDDLRQMLKGVYLEIEAGKVICTATNTNVLSTVSSVADIAAGKAVIIPTATLRILSGLPLAGDLSMSVSDNNICITNGDLVINSTLIDEKYPDYRSVIPPSNDKELLGDNQLFSSAVKRVSQFGIKATSQVILSLNPKEVTISAADVDFGEEAVEVVPCKYSGDPMVISLSAKQLMACFSRCETGDVKMTFSAPNRAALIYGSDNHLMLVMPFKI